VSFAIPNSPRCERLIDTPRGREQCPDDAAWWGTLHTGRMHFVSLACERHATALVDAEPLRGDQVQGET